MGAYTQLTREQRYQIYAFLKVGFSQSSIAKEIGVHKSTVSRELRRNQGKRGYRPKQAQRLATSRRVLAQKAVKLTPRLISLVENFLKKDFSPEQVSGFLGRTSELSISHETIYQHILKDKVSGGKLYQHLRHSNKKRKKRYGTYDRRGQIVGRISIDNRPAVVEAKKRIGDWEIDTIIGKNHKGALVTIVERKSKFTLIKRVPKKKADMVANATIDLLKPFKRLVLTITADNGKEFARHILIAKELKSHFFFAHPYHSWERGLNENTNGLIRQYFPKSSSFKTITDKQIQTVMDRLNNRPRKTLGFKTPNEVFLGIKFKLAA
jgi:IS30 family transposase